MIGGASDFAKYLPIFNLKPGGGGSPLTYLGTWNAQTNSPALVSSVGEPSTFYIVNVAGNTNLNGNTNWDVGDWAVFNGSVWQRVPVGETTFSPKNIIYIADNGSDTSGNGNLLNPVATIPGALALVSSPSSTNQWLVIDQRTDEINDDFNILPFVFIQGTGLAHFNGDVGLDPTLNSIAEDAVAGFGGYYSWGLETPSTFDANFSTFVNTYTRIIYLTNVPIAPITAPYLGSETAQNKFVIIEANFNTLILELELQGDISVSGGINRVIRNSAWQCTSITKGQDTTASVTSLDVADCYQSTGDVDNGGFIMVDSTGGNNQQFINISMRNSTSSMYLNIDNGAVSSIQVIYDSTIDPSITSNSNTHLTITNVTWGEPIAVYATPINYVPTAYTDPNLSIAAGTIGGHLYGIDVALGERPKTFIGDLDTTATVSDSTIQIYASQAAKNCGATVGFLASGNSLLLNIMDNAGNIYLGASTGEVNAGAFGTVLGAESFSNIITGTGNAHIGAKGFQNLTVGGYNLGGGYEVGSAYTSDESSNILFSSAGVEGDHHVTRIGTEGEGNGQQSAIYVAGISNTDSTGFGNAALVYVDRDTGQLGYGGGGGAGIEQIDGDTGSATGSTVTIKTGVATTNAGKTFLFNGSGATLTLNVTDSNSNTFVGLGSGNGLDGAVNDTAFGKNALFSITEGSEVTAVGAFAAALLIDGDLGVYIGYAAANGLLHGGNNTVVGAQAAGDWNDSESGNILITCESGSGSVGDTNITRIGFGASNAATQAECYIDGINGVNVTGTAVMVDSNGQLGVIVSARKYKQNIRPMGLYSRSILDLEPVLFDYINGANDCVGLIADDVAGIAPELVVFKDGQPETVRYHDLPVLLLNEIKHQRQEINELRKVVNL